MDKLRNYALYPVGRADLEDTVLGGIYLARLALERNESIVIANFPYLTPAVILDRILDERGMEAVKNVILHELDVAEKRERPSIKSEYRETGSTYEIYARLRKANGLLDFHVSKATGIPASTFSDWKRGRSAPKIEKLKLIADFFGVSVDYFLNGADGTAESEVG